MFSNPTYIDSNGIRLAVYEAGAGPAVIFVHGFPDLAYSWRFQLPAFAAAGYRAIAPDMRGYGHSDGPDGVEQYSAAKLIDDLHGLLDAFDLERATFVGHDWGAIVLWQMAMLAPERIEKLVILNIPHYAHSKIDPIERFRQRFGDDFYIVNFVESDEADRVFDSDPARVIDRLMRRNQVSRAAFNRLPASMQALSLLKVMRRTAPGGDPLLTSDELDYYAKAFERSGFTNPINWYRNWSRNWKALDGVNDVIDLPTLFIGAADDNVISLHHIEAMKSLVTNLTIEMLEPCGHWTQQERPDDVNRLILDWLNG